MPAKGTTHCSEPGTIDTQVREEEEVANDGLSPPKYIEHCTLATAMY